MPRAASKVADGPRLDQQLVLHRFICAQFGYGDMRAMLSDFADKLPPEALGDDYHPFITRLISQSGLAMDNDALEGYGRNIQAISNQLGMGPGHASSWKPHQYLALLFTERYLDLWFDDAAELCTALNAFRAGDKAFANVPDYEVGDLSTLAYQSATASPWNIQPPSTRSRKHRRRRILMRPRPPANRYAICCISTANA